MFQMTLNKHAKFHGDRTIGGAITVKKASKHSISKVNWPHRTWIHRTPLGSGKYESVYRHAVTRLRRLA